MSTVFYPFDSERIIGTVCEAGPGYVKTNLPQAAIPHGQWHYGTQMGGGEVGDFVTIDCGESALLGRLTQVKLPERDRLSVEKQLGRDRQAHPVGSVQLLTTINLENMDFVKGITCHPRLGANVYAAHPNLLKSLAESGNTNNAGIILEMAQLPMAGSVSINLTPESLFGRHCAILGATGGGKSWTLARVIEQVMRFKCKLILIDATSEYRGFCDQSVVNCHLGKPVEMADCSISCCLPPTSFMESDFVALFEPAGKVQGPKLRAAIRSLRLAKLKPALASDGYIKKFDQQKQPVYDAAKEDGVSEKLDNPRQPFEVKHLVAQIEQECVWPDGYTSGKKDCTKWGGEDGNFSHCLSLVARINGVLTSPAFTCIFAPSSDDSDLTHKIDSFLDGDSKLLRICLSGIDFEFNAREIIANAIGRYVLNKARNSDFLKIPLILLLDEAHNFLGHHIGTEDYAVKLDAFDQIAKEGRKYCLNLCIATQRPRDIPDDVLSQMGTLIVHRLTNDRDREVVERASGDIDRSAAAFLPTLGPGEAAIIGVDLPIPLAVKILPPNQKPHSRGADYQKHWAEEVG